MTAYRIFAHEWNKRMREERRVEGAVVLPAGQVHEEIAVRVVRGRLVALLFLDEGGE